MEPSTVIELDLSDHHAQTPPVVFKITLNKPKNSVKAI